MKITFLKASTLFAAAMMLASCGGKKKETATEAPVEAAPVVETLEIEKPQLTFGFIKLTDMAPLAIAKEKGFFEEEGLFVSVEAQSNWKNILDRVIDGRQPIAAGAGFGRQAELVTPFSMDLNGNGITVSNKVWEGMKSHVPTGEDGKPVHPISAEALKPVIEEYKNEGKPFKMGMVFPVSTHNYEIRYWLAAAGIKPGMYSADNIQGQIDAEVLLSVTPPPQMPATLEAGTIYGYCVGEPWNQQAVAKGIGVPVTTNYDIWKNNPEKVFVMMPQYVGAPEAVLANSMTGTFEFEKGDKREMPDFNVFYRYNATYPFYSDAVWFLTQMRRWGQYDGKDPIGYINSFAIGNKD